MMRKINFGVQVYYDGYMAYNLKGVVQTDCLCFISSKLHTADYCLFERVGSLTHSPHNNNIKPLMFNHGQMRAL